MAREITTAELDAAVARGRDIERTALLATAARYDAASGRLVIDFANGSTLLVPARHLQDLQHASDAELGEVTLAFGSGLRWDRLDVDFTISGLLAGVFGTERYMEALRRVGRSRSAAKTAAARENGRKGVRPRKPV